MTRTGQRAAIGAALIAAFLAGHFTSAVVPDTAPGPQVAAAPTETAPRARLAPNRTPIGPDRTQPNSPPIDLGNGSDCGLGGTCLDEKHLLIPLRG